MDVLTVTNLNKSFGGLTAVKDFSFCAQKNRVVSIIGPNGAGKTTIFNLLTGFYVPDSGTILFNGSAIKPMPSHRYAQIGITRTFQNIRLFSSQTVLANVMIGYQSKIKCNLLQSVFNFKRKDREDKCAEQKSREILKRVGLLQYENEICTSLPYGQQKRLEIARALVSDPQIIFLDEPAAGLNPNETKDLSVFIRSLADSGYAVVLIEHDMRLVMSISNYVYVVNHGVLIGEGDPGTIQKNEEVIKAYIGRRKA